MPLRSLVGCSTEYHPLPSTEHEHHSESGHAHDSGGCDAQPTLPPTKPVIHVLPRIRLVSQSRSDGLAGNVSERSTGPSGYRQCFCCDPQFISGVPRWQRITYPDQPLNVLTPEQWRAKQRLHRLLVDVDVDAEGGMISMLLNRLDKRKQEYGLAKAAPGAAGCGEGMRCVLLS